MATGIVYMCDHLHTSITTHPTSIHYLWAVASLMAMVYIMH